MRLEQHAWLRKLGQTVLSGGVGKAWRSWGEMLDERDRKLKLLRRALSGSARTAHPRTRTHIRDPNLGVIPQPKNQKPAGPVAACAAATLRELTRFYALSCACADLLRAWNQWLDVAEELRRLRTIGSRIVGAPLAHALRRWLEHIEELNQVRRLAKSRQVSWSSLAFHGLRRPLRDRRL